MARMLGGALLVAVPVTAAVGSAAKLLTIQARIDEALLVQGELERERIRLEGALAEMRLELAEARREAERLECENEVRDIRLTAKVLKAGCFEEHLRFAECDIENARREKRSVAVGCVGGALLTVVTGGAAAPALLACGGGVLVGEASKDDCPVPACAADDASVLRRALRKHGRTSLPSCET